MNVCQIRDLALKLLGLTFLFKALSVISGLAGLLASWSKPGELAQIMPALLISILLPFAFWLVCSLILVFRTAFVSSRLWVDEKAEITVGLVEFPGLSFWIVLIGFFFFMEALGGMIADVWVFFVKLGGQSNQTHLVRLIPHILALVISILCIGNARTIERLLDKKIRGKQSSD